jgi:hypothetical protein
MMALISASLTTRKSLLSNIQIQKTGQASCSGRICYRPLLIWSVRHSTTVLLQLFG